MKRIFLCALTLAGCVTTSQFTMTPEERHEFVLGCMTQVRRATEKFCTCSADVFERTLSRDLFDALSGPDGENMGGKILDTALEEVINTCGYLLEKRSNV